MIIWMSTKTKRQRYYNINMMTSFLAVMFIPLLLMMGFIFFGLKMKWSMPMVSTIAVMITSLMIVLGAVKLGKKSVQEALVFVQDNQRRMFVKDLRSDEVATGTLNHFLVNINKTQHHISDFKEAVDTKLLDGETQLIGMMSQIESVLNIKENKDGYAVVCVVLLPNGLQCKKTYFILHGYENEEELIYALRKLMDNRSQIEIKVNYNPHKIALSLCLLLICVLLCVASHPAIQWISSEYYFVFLGLSVIPLFMTLTFILKQKRGE